MRHRVHLPASSPGPRVLRVVAPAPSSGASDTPLSGSSIPLREREARSAHTACVLWFTGNSGAGKSTLATTLQRRLFDPGAQTVLLDGDEVRRGLCRDLGFSARDREENIRRVGEVASLFYQAGHVVLRAFMSMQDTMCPETRGGEGEDLCRRTTRVVGSTSPRPPAR